MTSAYEVLEPSDWVGREMPILEHIDIGEQLKEGNWLVVLYHHDCPSCTEALPKIEAMARELAGNEEFLRFALVEVPPYGNENMEKHTHVNMGEMDTKKNWFVSTPTLILMKNKNVLQIWLKDTHILEEILLCYECHD